MWVKVCGMVNEADVSAAVEGGADALGFVLATDSPRAVSLDAAQDLACGVPGATFIVTVDMPPDELLASAEAAGVTGVQPHGRFSLDAVAAAADAGFATILPVPVDAVGSYRVAEAIPDETLVLFDTHKAGMHGGTGVPLPWTLLDDPGRPFILAGGLGPDNVAEAIGVAAPFGVDASSGLESTPGVKDEALIRRFIGAAKTA